jgi:hypothetical protein
VKAISTLNTSGITVTNSETSGGQQQQIRQMPKFRLFERVEKSRNTASFVPKFPVLSRVTYIHRIEAHKQQDDDKRNKPVDQHKDGVVA